MYLTLGSGGSPKCELSVYSSGVKRGGGGEKCLPLDAREKVPEGCGIFVVSMRFVFCIFDLFIFLVE